MRGAKVLIKPNTRFYCEEVHKLIQNFSLCRNPYFFIARSQHSCYVLMGYQADLQNTFFSKLNKIIQSH